MPKEVEVTHVEVFERSDADGGWRVHAVGGNGEVIFRDDEGTKGYSRKEDAVAAASVFGKAIEVTSATGEVEILDPIVPPEPPVEAAGVTVQVEP